MLIITLVFFSFQPKYDLLLDNIFLVNLYQYSSIFFNISGVKSGLLIVKHKVIQCVLKHPIWHVPNRHDFLQNQWNMFTVFSVYQIVLDNRIMRWLMILCYHFPVLCRIRIVVFPTSRSPPISTMLHIVLSSSILS